MTAPWLALDIGSGSAKAALIADGGILRSRAAAYATQRHPGGIVEQAAADWWRAVVTICRELAPPPLAGIALTGQMQAVILLDEKGLPLRPVMLYSDTRAQRQLERLHERASPAELIAITGNEQTAGSLLAKLLWLQEHEPRSISRAARLLFGAADFIAARMTGVFVSDATTASTTGLWQLRRQRLLDAAQLQQLGLGWLDGMLPAVISGGEQVGSVTAEAARALGLAAGLPVYLAPGDAGSATIGAGCGEPGPAYAYVGSSGWVGFTAREAGDAAAGALTLAHPKRGNFVQVVPMMTSAGNLDWLQGIFEDHSHDEIITAALARPPSELLFLPYLHGERAPFNDPLARGAFIGIAGATEKADLWRAVLEGIVFAYRHTLSALMSPPPSQLTLIGGGARNAAFNQLFADAIGLRVQLPPAAENAGIYGALRAVAVRRGFQREYAIPPPAATRMLQPNPRHHARLARKYQHFREAYRALKPLFQRLAAG